MAETPEQQRARKIRRRRENQLSAEMIKVIKFIPKGVSGYKIALNYAKMMGAKGFNPSGLRVINPTLFKSDAVCRRYVLTLRNNGMIAQGDFGKYQITERGILAISLLLMRDPSLYSTDDDE